MTTRRQALAALAAAGFTATTFSRALAASASASAPVTHEMVKEAEWVAGIELSDKQRRMAANAINGTQKEVQQLRKLSVDYADAPAHIFRPFVTTKARAATYVAADSVEKSDRELASRPSDDAELAFLPVRTLGQLLRRREVSSVELTKLYLDRLQRYDPLLKCVVNFTEDVAKKQAVRADREIAKGRVRGPLHGIPWGAKDLLAFPGHPTTWGAPLYHDRIINMKATVIERLEAAGAVLVAKLSTGAFAGINFWKRGKTRNPWNPSQGADASSSGSAVAAAAGLVGFALGTETMGSIMHPCSRCGATGLRPTFGRVSRYGCMPLSWSLDKIGPICRTADDCGLILAAIAGSDKRDIATVDRPFGWPCRRNEKKIRVGYDEKKTSEEELQVLRDNGYTLTPVEFPDIPKAYQLTLYDLQSILQIESAATHEQLTLSGEPKGVKMWPGTWAWAHFRSAIDYLKLNHVRTILMKQMDELMQEVDVCIGDDGPVLTNMTGHPKVVVPKRLKSEQGFDQPQPQMFIGRVYDEATLLEVASIYQETFNIKKRPPLDNFLADKNTFLKDEEFPDETILYEG